MRNEHDPHVVQARIDALCEELEFTRRQLRNAWLAWERRRLDDAIAMACGFHPSGRR